VGAWVMSQAIRDLASWRREPAAGDTLWLCINLSGEQIRQPGLAASIEAELAASSVPPASVHLEITESVLMDRVDSALTTIVALRNIGARISIDDFGTGYSSLSYLSRLPVDTIKIDRSFVCGLITGAHDASIVRTIMALAVSLSLEVVAEGIEFPAQHSFLLAEGCTYGQGFLWSAALSSELVLAWIRDGRCLTPNWAP
jgi:EAL domain-containing protein (putative c-di-GMP-specific phosphodiesterase class I)